MDDWIVFFLVGVGVMVAVIAVCVALALGIEWIAHKTADFFGSPSRRDALAQIVTCMVLIVVCAVVGKLTLAAVADYRNPANPAKGSIDPGANQPNQSPGESGEGDS